MLKWTALREGFPVTTAGLALLSLAGAAFWFQGVRRLDLVLIAGTVLMVLLGAALLPATLAAAWFLRRRPGRTPAPLRLEGGLWAATGFRLSLRWLPFLEVRVDWEAPGGVQAESPDAERVRPTRRARCARVIRRITLGDILGLTAVTWREAEAVPVRILPRRAALDPLASLTGLVSGEEDAEPRGAPAGDRVDIRAYGHGDPARMILWKVYARTRRAFVRIPERAVEPARRICAFLPGNPWDEAPARLARTLLERGLLGPGWRFGADGAEDAEALGEALEALAASGSAATSGGFGPFLQRAARDGFGACLLLLPGRAGGWTGTLLAPLQASPLRVHAVFALEGWAEEEAPLWRRLLLRPRPARGSTPEEVLGLVDLFVRPGMASTLVDTLSGDVLDSPRAYLARRARREP